MPEGEGPEGPEEVGEAPDNDLEGFRKEIVEVHGPDGLKPTNDQEKGSMDSGPVGDKSDKLSDEDIEEFRRQIVEEYGPEGLGEGAPPDSAKEASEETETTLPIKESQKDAGDSEKQTTADSGSANGTTAASPDKQGLEAGTEGATGSSVAEGAETKAAETDAPSFDSKRKQFEGEAWEDDACEGLSFNRNDNQIVVTEQRGPSVPDVPSDSSMETPDLRRFPKDSDGCSSDTYAAKESGTPMDVSASGSGEKSNQGNVPEGLGTRPSESVSLRAGEERARTLPEGSLSEKASELVSAESGRMKSGSYQSDDVSRNIANDHQYVVLAPRPSNRPKDSGRSPERPDAVELLKASDYGHTSALLIPERMIPAHVRRSDVFELTVARKSEPEREYPLYATHKPGYDRAYLNLFQLEPKNGEEFLAKPALRYSKSDFIDEYNEAKPAGLGNTSLAERQGRMYLRAGGEEFSFVESKLRVYQGQVILDGRIEGAGDVKIAKSLTGFDFRLKDHSRVTAIRATTEGALLSYGRTGHDPYPHRRIIRELKGEATRFVNREGFRIVGQIAVESVSAVERDWWLFRAKADETARKHLRDELGSMEDPDEFRKLKGDIAEDIVKHLAPGLGMVLRADHPFNQDRLKTRSERAGPDLLISIGSSEELAYVEIKWWAIKANAAKEATIQVLDDLRKHPTWEGLKVTRAYIAILDLKPEEPQFTLTLKRVDGGETGARSLISR